MATVLDRFIARLQVSWRFRNDLAVADPSDTLDYPHSISLTDGEGANQAEMPYRKANTALATSGTDIIDLAAVLVSGFGTTITFKALKYLLLVNLGTGTLRLESDAAAGMIGIFKAVGDGIQIPAGGRFEWSGPTAAGAVVTATTADLLNIVNESGSVVGSYILFIVGTV